ncbi:MAG: MBL fold metallo-hydrolase [Promethearchaeota archaeon]|nr:MAG: MBL fold metallo-hydrolase [Candidatus Lokiarchaeota archaeon]
MAESRQWFEVKKLKDYLYLIRENLDAIDPRFHSIYTNLYLLFGTDKALLIDTGAGLYPIKPLVNDLIGNRELIVINTHCHWDHVGNNHEFNEILIHEIESLTISRPINITNLRDSSRDVVKRYEKNDFSLLPAPSIKTVKGGDKIMLGGLEVKVIHTPGHSPGSISLFTNRNELFTGDTAHYGSVYLPKKKMFPKFLESLLKLIKTCENKESVEIYPSHEEYGVGIELLKDLHDGILNLENIWDTKAKDNFLRSWIINDDKFEYVISRI